MPRYTPYHLRKIQERRAIIERPPTSKYDSLVDTCVLRLPLQAIELLTAHLTEHNQFTLPQANVDTLFEKASNFLVTDTYVPEPFPFTVSLTRSNSGLSDNPPAAMGALTELAPLLRDKIDVSYPNTVAVLLAMYAVQQLDDDHKATARARLARIHSPDTPHTFETVTETEASIYLSERSLRDSQLVNQTGVGMMYQSLVGRLEEMGLDPEDILPPGTLSKMVPEQHTQTGGETDTEQSIQSLMEEKQSETDALRVNLKFTRDCLYIRELHDLITEMLPYDTVDCPKLTWKKAAVAVKSNEDPFTTRDTDVDTDSDSTRGGVFPATPDSAQESESDTETQTTNQTGLSQF